MDFCAERVTEVERPPDFDQPVAVTNLAFDAIRSS